MNQTKRELIKLALNQMCEYEDNYNLNKWQRRWFTLKAIVCILINAPEIEGYNTITVAEFNVRSVYSFDCANAKEWEYLAVSYDKWQYDVALNSNC